MIRSKRQTGNYLVFNTRVCTAVLGVALGAGVAQAQTVLPQVDVNADAEQGYAVKQTTTATKTDTPLRDTPQSITVVTQSQIQDQSAQGLAEALRYVPGVGFAQGEGNRETPIFRGVSTTADFFVDGVRDDVQYYRDLYNIERVEVFKGPNAMIFGRGASGGLINRVTKVPTAVAKKEIAVTYGTDNNRRATFDINQPVSDAVNFRLNGLYEDSESYRDGVTLKRKGINPTVSMRLAPKTNMTLSYEHFEDDRIADRGVSSYAGTAGRAGTPVRVPASTFFGNAAGSPTWTNLDAVTALVEHTFDNGVELRNRTRWSDQDKFYQNVYASGPVNPSTGVFNVGAYNNLSTRKGWANQTDIVFNLEAGGVKHKILTGAEFGEYDSTNFRQTGTLTVAPTTASLANPIYSSPVTYAQSGTDANNFINTKVAAVYVQDQIELNKQWQIIAGLRYEKFDVDFRNNRSGATLQSSNGMVSPRVGVIYKPTEPVSIYANYSIAYQPRAGEQYTSLALTNQEVRPEKFENYEIGVKWDVNEKLAATAALFRLDRTNMFVLLDPNVTTSGVLASGQRTEGLELGLAGYVTRNWSVSGGYAYTDATFTGNVSNTVRAGAHVAQVPKHTFSLWNRYDFMDRWGAGLGVIHRTKSFAANEQYVVTSNVELPAYTRFDGALFLKIDKQWRAQLNVENIFDKYYYINAHSNTNITPGSPRAFRVSLIGSF